MTRIKSGVVSHVRVQLVSLGLPLDELRRRYNRNGLVYMADMS